MRILGVFLWIIIGALVLWFFAMNLGQYVTIHLFQTTYQNVNLVVVIFITLFIGTIVGAILLSSYVLNARSEVRALRKEKTKLMRELDGLRNMSIDEIPDADTKLDSETQKNDV
jgi:uncharacterized integral membrane protein